MYVYIYIYVHTLSTGHHTAQTNFSPPSTWSNMSALAAKSKVYLVIFQQMYWVFNMKVHWLVVGPPL